MIAARRGQTGAIDFGISLMVFTVAVIVTYAMLENTLEDTAHEDVRAQAFAASDLLLDEGFPTAWTNTTLLRAGLLADGTLSLRKARELGALSGNDLRRSLRATDAIAITLENESGGIEAIFGTCAVGDLSVTQTPGNRTLPTLALARSPYVVASGVTAGISTNDSGYALLDGYDVLLIEGNLSEGSEFTPAQISRILDTAARRGITVAIIGNPGVGVLGVVINGTNATEIWPTHADAAALGMPLGDGVNLTGGAPVLLPTISISAGAGIADYRELATTDNGGVAAATWIFGDARVWYVATSDGAFANGTLLSDALRSGIGSMVSVPWPACGSLTAPNGAAQIARYDRTIAHHDRLLTLRVLAWRDV